MSHYPFLAEIGKAYQATALHPSEVQAGGINHRVGFLDGTAGIYRTKLTQLAAAEAATKQQPFTGTVLQRAAAFQNADSNQAALKQRVQTLKAQVDTLRRKLERMGAKIDNNNQIDWGFSHRTVVYDGTAVLQAATRLRVHNGRLFSDDAHLQPFDTRLLVTANKGPGFAIYVMSENGNIHASPHSVGHRHHSSLLAGGNVAGAGEMKVHAGQLKWISNKSGHYYPATEHFLQTLHSLMKKGVNLDQVQVEFLSDLPPMPYASVPLFLAAKQAETGGVNDFEYSKMMAMLTQLPFNEFVPLAQAKGWRWAGAGEGLGVVTLAGLPVPHRDVRKWLKNELHRVVHATTKVKPGQAEPPQPHP